VYDQNLETLLNIQLSRVFYFYKIAIMAKKSELRKISEKNLQQIFEDHRKWEKYEKKEGKRADLNTYYTNWILENEAKNFSIAQ
jgi:hypothetical protein